MLVTFIIVKKLSKVNNRPKGENSPYQVTLVKIDVDKLMSTDGHLEVDNRTCSLTYVQLFALTSERYNPLTFFFAT
jgi:hypothetical protein